MLFLVCARESASARARVRVYSYMHAYTCACVRVRVRVMRIYSSRLDKTHTAYHIIGPSCIYVHAYMHTHIATRREQRYGLAYERDTPDCIGYRCFTLPARSRAISRYHATRQQHKDIGCNRRPDIAELLSRPCRVECRQMRRLRRHRCSRCRKRLTYVTSGVGAAFLSCHRHVAVLAEE